MAGSLAPPVTNGRAQTWSALHGLYWNTAANWTGGVLPANDGTADVTLGSANGYCYLDANWNVHSLNIAPGFRGSAGAGELRGDYAFTLTLQAGVNNRMGVLLLLAPYLDLRSAVTWTDTGGGTRVNGRVSGPGGIVMAGPGALTLGRSDNTFTGRVVILGGTLVVPGHGGLGATDAPVDLDGGILRYGDATVYSAVLLQSQRSIRLGSKGGTLQMRGGTLTLQGVISGSASLFLGPDPTYTTYDPHRFVFAGANTHAGNTTVTAATLIVAADPGASAGGGDVILGNYGVLSLGDAGRLASGRRVVMGPLGALALRNPGVDPAAILDPARNAGGFLALGTAAAWTSALDLGALGNGELFLGAGADSRYAAATLGPGHGNVYRLGGGVVNPAGGTSQLTVSGYPNVLTGTARVLVGLASYPGSPTPNTDLLTGGTVILKEANDYAGGTTVEAGTLRLGHDQALGTGPLILTTGQLGTADASRRTIPNPVLVNAPAANILAFDLTGPGPLQFTGPVDLTGGARAFSAPSTNVTFAAPLSNGSLSVLSGTWNLLADNSGLSGLRLRYYAVGRFCEDANLGAPMAALVLDSGTAELTDDAPAELTLSRPVNVIGQYSYVRIPAQKTITLAGKLTTGNNTGGLGKLGPGTLVLTGSTNVGSVSLDDGVLRVSNPGTAAVNPVGVSVSGPGTLAGAGRVGFTTVGPGARVAPGEETAPGILRVTSGLQLNGGSLLAFRLGTAGADRLVLDEAHLFEIAGYGAGPHVVFVALADAGGLAPGQTYTLVDWNTTEGVYGVNAAAFRLSAGPVGGTFAVVNNALQLFTAMLTPYEA